MAAQEGDVDRADNEPDQRVQADLAAARGMGDDPHGSDRSSAVQHDAADAQAGEDRAKPHCERGPDRPGGTALGLTRGQTGVDPTVDLRPDAFDQVRGDALVVIRPELEICQDRGPDLVALRLIHQRRISTTFAKVKPCTPQACAGGPLRGLNLRSQGGLVVRPAQAQQWEQAEQLIVSAQREVYLWLGLLR